VKRFVYAVAAAFALAVVTDVPAQSRGSKSSGSSSSSSSKPSSGGGSKQSSSSSKPSSGGSSKPLGSGSSSSQKPGGSSSPSSKPKFGDSKSSPPKDSGSKFGPTTPPKDATTSKKPPSGIPQSEKTRAMKQEISKKTFVAEQKASAPPKDSYKRPDGKEIKIDTKSDAVTKIRNRPSTDYTPERRRTRVEEHVVVHHYHHPSVWYYQQPTVYIGGGYSSSFWWMMMEWDAQRRAEWFYHNRDRIDRDAYNRGVADAEVRARLADLERRQAQRNPNYIDRDFANNPDLMYEDGYVEAAYNPKVVPVSNPAPAPQYSGSSGPSMFWSFLVGVFNVCCIVVAVAALWFVCFRMKLGS
jgi:hypothetical protein